MSSKFALLVGKKEKEIEAVDLDVLIDRLKRIRAMNAREEDLGLQKVEAAAVSKK